MTTVNDYVAVADCSPKTGDEIIDADGNKYRVDGVDYASCFLVAISATDERCIIPFSGIISGDYEKVVH